MRFTHTVAVGTFCGDCCDPQHRITTEVGSRLQEGSRPKSDDDDDGRSDDNGYHDDNRRRPVTDCEPR